MAILDSLVTKPRELQPEGRDRYCMTREKWLGMMYAQAQMEKTESPDCLIYNEKYQKLGPRHWLNQGRLWSTGDWLYNIHSTGINSLAPFLKVNLA